MSRSAKGLRFFLFFLIIFSIFLRVFKLDFPITLEEAKESYTAYSIIKIGRDTNNRPPGLFFQSDNDYLSSLGVYSRLPSIYLFGLTPLGVRLPSIILGIASIAIFFLIAKHYIKGQGIVAFSVLLFACSPFLIQINIFNLGLTAAVLFILLSYYFFLKHHYLFFIFASLSILASFISIPSVIIFLLFYTKKYNHKTTFVASMLFIIISAIYILKFNPTLKNYLVRTTTIQEVLPSSYTYIIDKNLSLDQTYGSPLYTVKFNFNRLVHNKIFYSLNQLAKRLVEPFNYETLTSINQAGFILDKYPFDTVSLPKFFFWEIPFILLGLIFVFANLSPEFKMFSFLALASTMIFKNDSLIFLVPVLSLSYALLVSKMKKDLPRFLLLSLIGLLSVFSYLSFLDTFWLHHRTWVSENDLRQSQIWSTITDKDLRQNKIFVTDRLGQPVFYYLFYEAVNPADFQRDKKLGSVLSSGIRRTERVGNLWFGTFRYMESDRKKNQLWVGVAGEFIGAYRDYKGIEKVTDGAIFKKVTGVKLDERTMGDELWFIRTVFKEKNEQS